MRFLADGPVIPDELIEQRNLGNVIFFCGAGISRPAGLPDFGGLTEQTIELLNARQAREAFDRKESFDRVFNSLIREFGRSEIDDKIFTALKTPKNVDLVCHRTIIDLSRGSAGQPQIVTTNFDLLFERADRTLKRIVPPALPDLTLGQSIDGVVYLHGRLTKPENKTAAGYVISSADFGRAYLAEGWAARFVKTLREQFAIILLGYTANDPPMRYLLEGLNARDGVTYNLPIYAFTEGGQQDAEEEWYDRGVTPICYKAGDKTHSGLWNTLSAWADATKSVDDWYTSVVALAQRPPSELLPHERGQVVSLLGSKAGAKIFADANPLPSAEWLCVLDAEARYAKPQKRSLMSEEEVDPLDIYGLDDDPPRPSPKDNEQLPIPGVDVLNWKRCDASFSERTTLKSGNSKWTNQLPERLFHLARWFGSVSDQPAAIWWAAGKMSLHSEMIGFVQRRLEHYSAPYPPEAAKFWRFFTEQPTRDAFGDHDYRWFEFERQVKSDGWSASTLRAFDRICQPFVEYVRENWKTPLPPKGNWDDLSLQELAEAKVRVPDRHGQDVAIPHEHLPNAVAIVRRSLLNTAAMLEEVETRWWRTPTLHPTGNPGETFHGRKEQYFLWFKQLFLNLLDHHPDAAKWEVAHWPKHDKFFFSKLSVYAAMFPTIMSPKEVVGLLCGLDDDNFWDAYSRREILFTLRARWQHFTPRQRRIIERKIIAGPEKWKTERKKDHRPRRASTSASLLRWLEINNCTLTPPTSARLKILMAVDERWRESWALSADDSLGPRGGAIERVTELRGLENLPINKIVEAAVERTEDRIDELKDYRPFVGMVSAFPLRALSALRYEMRHKRFPIQFWKDLLSDWPENSKPRLHWLLAKTLTKLPATEALELAYYVPDWLRKYLPILAQEGRDAALSVFDAISALYLSGSGEKVKSGIGHTSVGGVVQNRSEVSISKTINSPIGKLTEALWTFLPKNASSKRPMPTKIGKRLTALFQAPGDGGGHALCFLTSRLGWLDYCYRQWMSDEIIPTFSLSHPLAEAAWHGFAYNQHWPSQATLQLLKEPLLEVLRGQMDWTLDASEKQNHVSRLVHLTRKLKGEKRIITYREAQDALCDLDDKARADAVWTLANLLDDKGAWRDFVKPFIENAWPRQTRFKSENVSRNFAMLVEKAGDDFPEAVKVVRPFLRPVPHLDMITYRLAKDKENGEKDAATLFPQASLTLLNALIAEDRSQRPYELGKVLETIAEAQPTLRQSAEWRRLNDLAN
jgi:hypothetical protein